VSIGSSKQVGANNPPPSAFTEKHGSATGKPPTTSRDGKRASAAKGFSKKAFGTKTSDRTEEAYSKYTGIVTTEKPKASGVKEEPSMSVEDKDTPCGQNVQNPNPLRMRWIHNPEQTPTF
jgi:hypothetical protein